MAAAGVFAASPDVVVRATHFGVCDVRGPGAELASSREQTDERDYGGPVVARPC